MSYLKNRIGVLKQKLRQKLEAIQQEIAQIEEIKTELAELNQQAASTESHTRWRAELDECYYTVNHRVIEMEEDRSSHDKTLWDSGNYFRTPEQAQAELEKRFALTRVNDAIRYENSLHPKQGELLGLYYGDHGLTHTPVSENHFFADPIDLINSASSAEKIIKQHEADLKLIMGVNDV